MKKRVLFLLAGGSDKVGRYRITTLVPGYERTGPGRSAAHGYLKVGQKMENILICMV